MKIFDTIDRKNILLTGLKVSISFGLLYYLITKAQLRSILDTMGAVKTEYYFCALALFFLAQPLRVMRWHLFLNIKNIHVSQLRLLVLNFIGMFFNTFLPTMIGGDAVRVFYIYRDTHLKSTAAASVIVERFCGLFTLFGIGFISSIFFVTGYGAKPFALICLFISSTAIMGMAFLCSPFFFKLVSRFLKAAKMNRFSEKASSLYDSLKDYGKYRKTVLYALGLSFLFSLASILICFCLSLALSWGLPLYLFLVTIPVITIVAMVPISFGGLGIRESAFVIAFTQFGIEPSSAISLSILWYSINLISGAIGGLCFALYQKAPEISA